jgi:GDP-4-dehydro-6-deoxy-D-mannose reductase
MESAPRVMVIGSAGFTGQHLVAALRARFPRADLVGLTRSSRSPSALGLRELAVDLAAPDIAESVLGELRPTWIFNLLQVGAPNNLQAQLVGTIGPTQRLLEALPRAAPDATLVMVGSSAEYGDAGGQAPLRETEGLRPITPYGAVKALLWHLSYQAARRGSRVVYARTFNLLGPGLPERLFAGSLARRALAWRAGDPPLGVGNLESHRDFVDVRDAAAAYIRRAEAGEPGQAYNLASGRAVRIADLAALILAQVGSPPTQTDAARLQRDDVPYQVADISRIQQATGWQPRIPLEQTVADMLAGLAGGGT